MDQDPVSALLISHFKCFQKHIYVYCLAEKACDPATMMKKGTEGTGKDLHALICASVWTIHQNNKQKVQIKTDAAGAWLHTPLKMQLLH